MEQAHYKVVFWWYCITNKFLSYIDNIFYNHIDGVFIVTYLVNKY